MKESSRLSKVVKRMIGLVEERESSKGDWEGLLI
jgi:hypothetical protein